MSPPGSSLRAPLLWLLLPFMAGIALGDCGTAPGRPTQLLLLTSAVLLAIAGWRWATKDRCWDRFTWVLLLTVAGVLQGIVALEMRSPSLVTIPAAPREVVVELEVEQLFKPVSRRKTVGGLGRIITTSAHLEELRGQRLYFSVLRRIGVPPERFGRYRIRGVLTSLETAPRLTPGFRDYLNNAGVRLSLTRAQLEQETRAPGRFHRFCQRAESRLESILGHGLAAYPGERSLYLAMLLGEKAVLSADQQHAFMQTGTFHIFSISGLHVGVIATAILALLQLVRLSRRTATLVGLAILWLYVQVTGASVPAERAFWMILFLTSARIFRLPGNSLAALAAAALFTLWRDPRQLFNTGFQLSYTVVTAIILMAGPLAARWRAAWEPWKYLPRPEWGHRHYFVRWFGREFLDAWAATWAALLAGIPAAIGYFSLISPGSLLANLLVLPLSTLAIIAGLASLLGGLSGLEGISLIFNHAAVILIRTMAWFLQRGVELPGMYFPAQFTFPWLAPLATVLVLATMFAGACLHWPRRWGATWWPVLAVTLILFLSVKLG